MTTTWKWTLTLDVARTPADLYALVSDLTRSPQWSKECTGVEWLDDAQGPAIGARFRGENRRRLDRWSTIGEVVAADPGRVFSFQTLRAGRPETRWTFTLASSDESATQLSEECEVVREPTLWRKVGWRWLGGIRDREADLLDNLRRSLDAIRRHAEEERSAAPAG